VAKDFPTIKLREMIVDNTCMQLASNPEQFDVMVCPPCEPLRRQP
jgi:isocitrate/isopropylmalate dehydrogenase